MEFLTFEDTTGLYDVTLFPDAYRRFCHLLFLDRPYRLRGLVEENFGVVTLTVEHVSSLDEPRSVAPASAPSTRHDMLRYGPAIEKKRHPLGGRISPSDPHAGGAAGSCEIVHGL
jgi:DNA polymerase III alpha subunit